MNWQTWLDRQLDASSSTYRPIATVGYSIAWDTAGQIIRPLASVCVSVCHRFCGCNFKSYAYLMILCTVVWGWKTKIECVRGQNKLMPSLILPPIFTTPNAFQWDGLKSKHCSIDARWPIVAVNISHDAPWQSLENGTTSTLPKTSPSYKCPMHLQLASNRWLVISQWRCERETEKGLVTMDHLWKVSQCGSYGHVPNDVTWPITVTI